MNGTQRMSRQRDVLEFRTPQHPSFGTNHWGGASPLLARNIPKEALDQRYSRLNTIRDRDQIFPSATIEEEIFCSPPTATIRDEIFSFPEKNPATSCRKWLLRRFRWRPQNRSMMPSARQGFKWSPKWDRKKRWPNGWC